MNVSDIREKFLAYFESQGSTRVTSSSLVPGNDPTLLFTNSGMVQFKDVFLGQDKRPYTRATTAQRCVRAGGKHNDLENVGYTARHHTFFEMLGNFSFGDYFKRDAIHYAWELLTTVYKLPADKLWVTVYAEDDEAHAIWAKEVGVPLERIIRIGDNKGARYASDNFWQMADTGPCGPCSEIFYDHGPDVWGGPPGSPEGDGDRYIEVWNLVFMQYERSVAEEMSFASEVEAQAAKAEAERAGTITLVARQGDTWKLTTYSQKPLPRPCVDTGMGLERIAAVLQHVHSNYEIDLFRKLIQAAGRETGCADLGHVSLKVIADHIRACAFLIVDGVIPGNEGRGYVLRRITRRALRHGYKLGQHQPFFHKLVPDLVAEMGAAYSELAQASSRIQDTLEAEEKRFGETLENGMRILDAELDAMRARGASTLSGDVAFALYDTYGFPLDLTADVCRERDLAVDDIGFDVAMERQREQARAAGKFKMAGNLDYNGAATQFQGYDHLQLDACKILALYVGGTSVQRMEEGEEGVVVLDCTPFYAESGGQVGDSGVLFEGDACGLRFLVVDTQKIQADVFGHHGQLEVGSLHVGETVAARVDTERRHATMRNHSATHLLHKALRLVLGEHVQQKGSLVDAEKTRFDFAHGAPISAEDIQRIERWVNEQILRNAATQARVLPIEDAKKTGAMMLFGEKYGDVVRVLDIGDSRELCGGTHVARTGDIGSLRIVSQGAVAAGVRRVEATTGMNALQLGQRQSSELAALASLLKAPEHELDARAAQLLEQLRALEKDLAALKDQQAVMRGVELATQAQDMGGVKFLAARLDGADATTLRSLVDQLKARLKSAVVLLASTEGDKVQLAAGVTQDLTARIKAGELVSIAARQVGGKGGGRPDFAMAGGSQPRAVEAALAAGHAFVAQRLVAQSA
ncbi:MAG: alanine--tRNA ligase [Betaproteobacteria bacterium]|nr:alanine--tRNA ligase [Betaproteobacteria bacterium]MDE2124019.1 alanine--tRNA ligase [Betaproteobacteria bacterium]MDE2185305.1 alanine--tRNA ligase [Betaproteobacteria bacterium]MDE2324369.1 alanine--tRNA ligase [Betaproteobacteria bacterium]